MAGALLITLTLAACSPAATPAASSPGTQSGADSYAATASTPSSAARDAAGTRVAAAAETADVAARRPAPPVGVARPRRHGSARISSASDVRLAGYDPAAGRAVLTVQPKGSGASASPPPGSVEVGDVVASAPTAGAPHGALFKVAATSRTSEGLIVTTGPATVSELLGDATVTATVPTSHLDISVKPLDPGVTGGPATTGTGTDPGAEPATGAAPSATASATANTTTSTTEGSGAGPVPARARTAAATPSGRLSTQPSDGLLLRLDVPVSAPGISATRQGGPKLSGWVRIAPELIFSYQRERSRTQPGTAAIGVGGKYEYGWQLHAKIDRRADTGKKPLRVPFAEVHLNTVVWVGPLPVVIDADLTYFYRISAEGRLSIDNEQRTRGEFAFGARYDTRAGWSPMRDHKVTTTVGKRNEIRGSGTATTALGARLAVYLYGTVGLTGELAPFLRTAVHATPLTLRWDLYGGFDLDGALSLRLQIFGIPILEQHLAFPTVHQEWRIAGSPA